MGCSLSKTSVREHPRVAASRLEKQRLMHFSKATIAWKDSICKMFQVVAEVGVKTAEWAEINQLPDPVLYAHRQQAQFVTDFDLTGRALVSALTRLELHLKQLIHFEKRHHDLTKAISRHEKALAQLRLPKPAFATNAIPISTCSTSILSSTSGAEQNGSKGSPLRPRRGSRKMHGDAIRVLENQRSQIRLESDSFRREHFPGLLQHVVWESHGLWYGTQETCERISKEYQRASFKLLWCPLTEESNTGIFMHPTAPELNALENAGPDSEGRFTGGETESGMTGISKEGEEIWKIRESSLDAWISSLTENARVAGNVLDAEVAFAETLASYISGIEGMELLKDSSSSSISTSPSTCTRRSGRVAHTPFSDPRTSDDFPSYSDTLPHLVRHWRQLKTLPDCQPLYRTTRETLRTFRHLIERIQERQKEIFVQRKAVKHLLAQAKEQGEKTKQNSPSAYRISSSASIRFPIDTAQYRLRRLEEALRKLVTREVTKGLTECWNQLSRVAAAELERTKQLMNYEAEQTMIPVTTICMSTEEVTGSRAAQEYKEAWSADGENDDLQENVAFQRQEEEEAGPSNGSYSRDINANDSIFSDAHLPPDYVSQQFLSRGNLDVSSFRYLHDSHFASQPSPSRHLPAQTTKRDRLSETESLPGSFDENTDSDSDSNPTVISARSHTLRPDMDRSSTALSYDNSWRNCRVGSVPCRLSPIQAVDKISTSNCTRGSFYGQSHGSEYQVAAAKPVGCMERALELAMEKERIDNMQRRELWMMREGV